MKRDVNFVAGIFCLSVAAGCANQDYEVASDSEALVTIETQDDFTIEFAKLPNGVFVVSEVGPGNAPSKIAHLAVQKATPLEIYLAVAPGEDVPRPTTGRASAKDMRRGLVQRWRRAPPTRADPALPSRRPRLAELLRARGDLQHAERRVMLAA